jgi:membrane fusion protein (multidrug efflux system)
MAENEKQEQGGDQQEGPPPKGDVIIVGPRAQIHIEQGGGKKDDEGGDKKDEGGDKKEDEGKKKKFTWSPLKIALVVVLGVVVLVAGILYLWHALSHEETDDAYTTAYVHLISARVTSNVIELDVQDNQQVHEGQVLMRLDPRDFIVQVDKAQADYNKAKADFDRVFALRNDVAISKQDYDQTETNMEVAAAQLEDAKNQLSYCTIVAPSDGFVGNRTVNVGNRVTVGGALMAVVQDVWVIANYKETQLGKMKAHQQVQITVDAIPKRKFRGYIDSFSPGTGATFALLPPDNATGNFTKIVQRVPVKILFEPDDIRDDRARLVPGLSVETSVDLDAPLVHQDEEPAKLSR